MMQTISVLGLLLAVLLAGCNSTTQDELDISHVHGIAYVDGELYLASHHGLAVGTPSGKSWRWEFAGAERFDLMGFTVDSNGTFYASGHPSDPRAFGGTMLGLRKSTDQGASWEQVSYKGRADFHALTAVPDLPGHLVAWWQGSILNSTDGGVNWVNQTSPPASVYALAATASTVWAGTLYGLYRSDDGGRNWTLTTLGDAVASISVSLDGTTLYASELAREGGVTWVSKDGGGTWNELGGHAILRNTGAPIVFAIDEAGAGHAFASDGSGTVIETRDFGATWKLVRG